MIKLFISNIGRLRIIGFFEGISLIILLFIAVPIKYIYNDTSWVKTIGPIHGALFLLFVINTVSVAIQQKWRTKITLKVLLSCIIPLGTFFVDHFILRPEFEGSFNTDEQ